MKQFLIFALLTTSSIFCMEQKMLGMEPPKPPAKKEHNQSSEPNAYRVAMPHGGVMFFCDWPGSAPIAYALILREQQRQRTLPIVYNEETYPHMP